MSVGIALTAGLSPSRSRAAGPKAHRATYGQRSERASPVRGSLDRFPGPGDTRSVTSLRRQCPVENRLELERVDLAAVGVRRLALGVVGPGGAGEAQVRPGRSRRGARV